MPPLPEELGETTGQGGAGGTYLYVRRELVVAGGQQAAVRSLIAELWPQVREEAIREHPVEGLEMTRLELPEGAPTVPQLMDSIRLFDGGESLLVSPNYPLGWTSHPGLIPCGPPLRGPVSRALEQAVLGTDVPDAAPVLVAVIDTGVVDHPWLQGRCEFRLADRDEPDRDTDGLLDYGVGHGTFITGLVLEHTPRVVRVTVRRVQTTSSSPPPHQPYATDVDLAASLLEWSTEEEFAKIGVLVIAMGGYTFAGEGLPTTERALQVCRSKNPDLVVVAGAGNDNTQRPFFPAALKDVVAVAALREKDDQRACFSNFGWWVDACAPGVNLVSTFPPWTGRALAPHARPSSACRNEVPETPQGNQDFDLTAEWRGTSFAAPIVAAWIARQLSTRGISGRAAVDELRDVVGVPSGSNSLGGWLPGLGRVVRPPF